jgi:hypothetical protein
MTLAIPREQWRSAYAFLAPSTFPRNFVNIIARSDQSILLDGKTVSGFRSVEGTSLSTARVEIEGGQHTIESAAPFGIVVYGYADHTSYIFPAASTYARSISFNPAHAMRRQRLCDFERCAKRPYYARRDLCS